MIGMSSRTGYTLLHWPQRRPAPSFTTSTGVLHTGQARISRRSGWIAMPPSLSHRSARSVAGPHGTFSEEPHGRPPDRQPETHTEGAQADRDGAAADSLPARLSRRPGGARAGARPLEDGGQQDPPGLDAARPAPRRAPRPPGDHP